LASRELPITVVALDIGFSDVSTLTASFHRLTGQTPTSYRRNLD
jgi:AraC family transcriptional regulator